ncbi:MAG: RpiB/LacA/LacB family sugar-phosphate isomerase [Proteobacteria bacterium]|nr:RpiB/LacA/LacB family sugar-phosphate isomerase [Pseudomonadota bacterium]
MKRIAIGSDHGGYILKQEIMERVSADWINVGTFNQESSSYVEFAKAVSSKIQNHEVDFGIIICRSGIGVSIVANRYKQVYAALCLNNSMAKSARTHNNANVLCIAADYTTVEEAVEMIKIFLSTDFEAGTRHEDRFNSINVDN